MKLLSSSTSSMGSRRSVRGLLFTIILPHRSFNVRRRRTRKIAVKKGKKARAQGTSSASPWHQRRALTPCDTGESHTTRDTLLDDVSLGIFDLCRKNHDYTPHEVWKWHLLVHVCQNGDKSYSHHHTVSTSNFSVHSELLSGRVWYLATPSYRRGLLFISREGPYT